MYTFAPQGADRSLAVPPGTLVLLRGPETSAKQRMAMSLLAGGHHEGDRAVVASTHEGPGTLFRRLRSQVERGGSFDPQRLGIVHGPETVDSLLPEGLVAAKRDGRVQQVERATAFAAVGAGISRALSATDDADRYWLLFDSLSDVVERTDVTDAYKFAHVIGERLSESGGVGVLVVDQGHQPETTRLLARAADGVFEVRPADKLADGDCEFRLRGLEGLSGWHLADTEAPEDWPDSERERERAWRRGQAYQDIEEER